MSEENEVMESDVQDNVDKSESTKTSSPKKSQVNKSSGEWGIREGKKFTFNKCVKDINDFSVYPLTYKSVNEEEAEDGRKLIVLRLSNDNEQVKFYKAELYEKFGIKIRRGKKEGRKACTLSLTDAEHDFIKKIVLKLLDDKHYEELLMSKNLEEMKDLLDISREANNTVI